MNKGRLREYQTDFIRRNKINTFVDLGKVFFILLGIIAGGSFLIFHFKGSVEKADALIPPIVKKEAEITDWVFRDLQTRGYPLFDEIEDNRYFEYINGYKVVYTVDPAIQKKTMAVFKKYRVPYGSLVAMEPSTGKILAYASYSRLTSRMEEFNQKATYPAASLFKVVTASGAIEEGLLSRSSVFGYAGNPYRLAKAKLKNNPKRDRNLSTLEDALGKSNNVVFAKVGANILGEERLRDYSERFFFNGEIDFDFPLELSRVDIPSDRYQLGRVSAGYGGAYISPVHAALLAATIASGGEMPRPTIVERIEDLDGKILYQAKETPLKRVISSRAAEEVSKMMLRTTEVGTSSGIFRRHAKKMMKKVEVAGKTGTLTGKKPPGLYDWFIGFGSEKDSEIAVASLVINNHKWRIKGTYVAQSALKTYFHY